MLFIALILDGTPFLQHAHTSIYSSMKPLLLMLDNLSTQWKTWKEQFGSYLIATGLDKAPKEKQLAIFLQRLGTDRPRILPTNTGNNLKQVPLKLPLKNMCIN